MAFASSMIEVQKVIIKHCDLCEDEEEVNWFCKNCNQNLCDRCKKIHPKIVSFKDHQLISLCQDHNEPFSFYCRQCENSICSKCLSLIHKEHDLIEISVYQSELQDRLHDVLTEKETENEQIKSTLDAIFRYEEECKKTLTESFAIIDERRKAIRQDVDEECEEMKTWLKTITDQQMKGVSENKRKVEERQFAYDETVQTIKRQLPLQTTTTLSQFVKTSICDFQSLKPLSYPIPRINTFVVGRSNKKYIREMIGSYSSTDDIPCQSGRLNKENAVLKQLQIVSMYELDAQIRCSSICTSPDGNIWISHKSFVYKMSSDCSTILLKIPTRDNGQVGSNLSSYIACLKSGDAVLFYDKSFHIYLDKFTSDGRREEFTRLLPYFPYMYGMTVSKQDEVIIAAGEKTRRRFYKRIEIFSNEGKRLNSISVTKSLDSFCSDSDGNLVISDTQSSYLTIIDRNGSVLKEIPTMTSGLRQMTCDRFGNILGVLCERKAVCLISGDGKVQRLFTVPHDNSMFQIKDMSINRDGHLLILVGVKKIIVAKYLE